MYEAPNRYKRLISARLPGGESAGLAARNEELESSPLRDVQLISRAHLAPFFAAANVVASLILAAALWGAASPLWLVGWVGAVGAVNFAAMQLAATQSISCVGRSGRRVPLWLLVGEVAARAAVWLSLPLYLFPSLGPGEQVITASVMAGLGVGALGLVVIPPCANAWMIAFTGGVAGSLLVGRHSVPFQHMLSIVFTLGVSIFGVLTVARWAFLQLKTNADVGSQSESASLLLQEYEQRGVGWLWQIDSENRVTYISSRMSALLGRPANALLGHSLPALLGGHAELGRVLLEKQPFNALEMELKTGRGSRWISIGGDPIIDTAGRFEGFRGVGSDVTEIRQTQERLTHLANVDVLSGLPNRGRVRQLLGEALRGATSTNVPCAIMFLDLDGFKPVNDTFGHPKGDAVLRAVAKRLVDEVADNGNVGRMGGDEFAIVIPDAQGRTQVEQLADRIIQAIKEPYVGTPGDVYDNPATAFVHGFIGESIVLPVEVTGGSVRLGGQPLNIAADGAASGASKLFIRRHDMQIGPAGTGSLEGAVRHVRSFGPIQRAEIALSGGGGKTVIEIDAPRDRELQAGEIISLQPRRYRIFAAQD